MRLAALLVGSLGMLPATLPSVAQTTNDDTSFEENWWDRVGAGFFSDASLRTPRPEFEIRAHWTGLSPDDQAAVRARCARGPDGTAASLQEGDEDNNPDSTAAERADATAPRLQGDGEPAVPPAHQDTTTTGSVEGEEVQRASLQSRPAADTGLAGGFKPGAETGFVAGQDGEAETMVTICDLIREL